MIRHTAFVLLLSFFSINTYASCVTPPIQESMDAYNAVLEKLGEEKTNSLEWSLIVSISYVSSSETASAVLKDTSTGNLTLRNFKILQREDTRSNLACASIITAEEIK